MIRTAIIAVAVSGLCALEARAERPHTRSAEAPEAEWERGRLAAGPQIAHMSLEDVDTGQQLDMGGIGGAMRFRASRRIGVELGFDVLVAGQRVAGAKDDITRVSMPLTSSLLIHGWPDSRFQPYLLAGLGIVGHTIRYEALGQQLDFSTPMVHVGLGFEYRFESIRFDASLRSFGTSRDGSDVEWSPLSQRRDVGQHNGIHDLGGAQAGYAPRAGDRYLDGVMLKVGLLWGF